MLSEDEIMFLRQKRKEYRERSIIKLGRENYNAYSRNYLRGNKKHHESLKKWRLNNLEKANSLVKDWQKRNPDKIKLYRKKKYEKIKNDPVKKLGMTMRNRLREVMKQKAITKTGKLSKYLDCDLDTLKAFLEGKFLEGMSWENHGEWHIDHIIPLAIAKTEEELMQLFNYRNLQPLWAIDNLKKNSKYKAMLNAN